MFFNEGKWTTTREENWIEAEAIMKDSKFEDGFNELETLSDNIAKLQRKFNLKLEHLRNNPPDDTYMRQWQELKDLKPYPVNDY